MDQRRHAFTSGRENSPWKGEGIALALALTVMVCGLRKPHTIGYEMLKLGTVLMAGFGMLFGSSLINFPLVTFILGNYIARGDDFSLRYFALAFLAFGLWLRFQRKREKWDPKRPHRLDPGVSWFTFLPIREDYVYRFVDPGVAFLVGLLLRSRLGWPMLGLWWMVAGVALATVEWGLYQQIEQHDWQLGDSPKEAARDAEAIKGMADKTPEGASGPAMPTGMDANLAEEIKRREREREGEAKHDVA